MKIVIVSFTFPPAPGVGGRRITELILFLASQGHDVTLITSGYWGASYGYVEKVANIYRIGEVKSSDLIIQYRPFWLNFFLKSRIGRFLKEFLQFPCGQIAWARLASDFLKTHIRNNEVDIILSSALPVASHIAVNEAMKTFDEPPPWIMEFRDLWADNHYNVPSLYLKRKRLKLEKGWVKHASGLVSVSEPLVSKLAERYSMPIKCIPNGFHPRDNSRNAVSNSGCLNIVYTGILYDGRRNPIPFILESENIARELGITKDIHIHFYGPREELLIQKIGALKLAINVSFHGEVSHEEAILAQLSADALLYINSNLPGDEGVASAKLFEYLSVGKPIYAIGNCRGLVENILNETKCGHYMSDHDMSVKLKREFSFYKLYGRLEFYPKNEALKGLTWYSRFQEYQNYLKCFLR